MLGSPTPENQSAVANKRDELISALERSRFNNYPIGLDHYLREMDIGGYLPKSLIGDLRLAFSGNDITPSITKEKFEEIRRLAIRLIDESKSHLDSSEFFEIYSDAPEDGKFDFSITIPRDSVDNELDNFGRELIKIDKILGVFCEIATGSRDDFKIKSISSSDLTVVLESIPAVAVMIATALERVSSLYERVLNIIKLHKEMKDNKLPDSLIKGAEKFIKETLEKEIEQAAKDIEENYLQKTEATRRNELRTELKNSLREIASRFDRGYIFDVRGSSPPENEEDNGSAEPHTPAWQRKVVAEKREKLKHFKVQDQPILGLPEPDNDQ
jgi:hypothetical protein